MLTKIRYLKLLLSAMALLFINSQAIADVAVIVSADSDISSMSKAEVKAAYLGKNKKFFPTTLPKGDEARDNLMSKVIGKSESQFQSYWSKKIFSGKGIPPKVVDNASIMKKSIAGSSKAVGYIDSSQVDDSVKVVYTIE